MFADKLFVFPKSPVIWEQSVGNGFSEKQYETASCEAASYLSRVGGEGGLLLFLLYFTITLKVSPSTITM
ncbi:hypothetical protein M2133_000172 [Parabacteroides sp. PF5-6]|nr:hypothetical protein [Parabacteroides sp. PF5-6]